VDEELGEANENLDDPVSKYRALLQGIEQQEQKKKKFCDVEMEVSWGVGLKDKTEELVQKRLKERKGGLTPFEHYLEKRKEKRKQKKEVKKWNTLEVTTLFLCLNCIFRCCFVYGYTIHHHAPYIVLHIHGLKTVYCA
jgi:hypothetical protein